MCVLDADTQISNSGVERRARAMAADGCRRQGLSNAQIAKELRMTEKQVEDAFSWLSSRHMLGGGRC